VTSQQLKTEINQVLDQVPDELLVEILAFLKVIQSENTADSKRLISNFRKVLSEDKDLLHKLSF